MTSGVRRLTFSRAVVPLEIRFVLMEWRRRRREALLQQFSARPRERRVADHDVRVRIGGTRIVYPNYFRAQRAVLRLSRRNVHGGPIMHEREKLRSRFTVQANTTVRPRIGMNKSLMKTVGWRELTPIAHGIADVTTWTAPSRGNNGIPAHAEAVGAGTLVFLFRVDREVTTGSRLLRQAD